MEVILWITSKPSAMEKRDAIFFAFRARSNQAHAKERKNPSLCAKAARNYAELLRALDLNTC